MSVSRNLRYTKLSKSFGTAPDPQTKSLTWTRVSSRVQAHSFKGTPLRSIWNYSFSANRRASGEGNGLDLPICKHFPWPHEPLHSVVLYSMRLVYATEVGRKIVSNVTLGILTCSYQHTQKLVHRRNALKF